MFENDWLSRQIEIISRSLSVLLLNKDLVSNIISEELENKEGLTIEEETLLSYMLNKYMKEGKINEAENLLFESIENSQTDQKLQIALWFYKELDKLSESTLIEHNFSKQEILSGLGSIKQIYSDIYH